MPEQDDETGRESVQKRRAKRKTGPAYGAWVCYPAEFWMQTSKGFAQTFRYCAAVFGFGVFLGVTIHNLIEYFFYGEFVLGFFDFFGIFGSLIFAGFSYFLTIRPIKKRTKGEFHVTIELRGTGPKTVLEGLIKSTTKWSGDFINPDSDIPHKLSSAQATVVLQNVLPRLYDLQRAADGKHGLLKINASEGLWRFNCQRGPILRASCYIAIGLCLLLFSLCAALTFDVQAYMGVETTLPQLRLTAGALLLPSIIMLQFLLHAVALPGRLYLEVANRPNNVDIVDVTWTEYHGWTCDVHKQWAAFGNAQGLRELCIRTASLSKYIRLERFSIEQLEDISED